MPTRPETSRSRRLVVVAAALLCVLSACTAQQPSPDVPSVSVDASGSPTPAVFPTTPQASDGGALVVDHGFTVWDAGRASNEESWVVTLKNTSKTDMLLFAQLDLVWLYGGDEGAPAPHQVTGIRPGQEIAFGDQYGDARVPTDLRVAPSSLIWGEANALGAIGFDAGTEVTEAAIDVPTLAGERVKVTYSYVNHFTAPYFSGPPPLIAVLVLRDSESRLLGAWRLGDILSVGPSGEGTGDLSLDSWRDADPKTSTVSVYNPGTGWPGRMFGFPTPRPYPTPSAS